MYIPIQVNIQLLTKGENPLVRIIAYSKQNPNVNIKGVTLNAVLMVNDELEGTIIEPIGDLDVDIKENEVVAYLYSKISAEKINKMLPPGINWN